MMTRWEKEKVMFHQDESNYYAERARWAVIDMQEARFARYREVAAACAEEAVYMQTQAASHARIARRLMGN